MTISDHKWELPVLRYARNIIIYQYPVVWLIFMAILHVFITNNYPKLFSNNYPKYKFWVIYPFYAFTIIYIQIHFSQTITDCTRGNSNVLIFGIMLLIETMISVSNYMLITILNFLVLHYRHVLDNAY